MVTSTIVGTTIFAALTKEQTLAWKIVTGLLSVFAAALSAVQTFFRHAENAEKHRSAAANYAGLSRVADLLRLRAASEKPEQDTFIKQLEALMGDLDKLERESPNTPDATYDRAVKEDRSDTDPF